MARAAPKATESNDWPSWISPQSSLNRPPGFNLVTYSQGHAEEVEALRSEVATTLKVPLPVAPILQHQFGRYCTVLDRQHDHALVEVRAHLLTGLAEQLAGWGSRIDVISPTELRTELARIGADLVRHHA